jgi:hypothetical protein
VTLINEKIELASNQRQAIMLSVNSEIALMNITEILDPLPATFKVD